MRRAAPQQRRHLNLRRRSDHRPTAGPEMDEAPDPGPGACHTRARGELNRRTPTLGDAQTAVPGVKPVSRRLRLTPVSSGDVPPGGAPAIVELSQHRWLA